jgi:hypothetical protein
MDVAVPELPVLMSTHGEEEEMRYGLIGTILIVLLIAFIIKNLFVGGLGGLLLIVLIVLLVSGRI